MYVKKEICTSLSDQEIVQKSLVDVEYFACLVIKYETRLLDYIRKVTQVSNSEAEDILQESFIKIWKNLNHFDPTLKFENWIFRIVHNETISFQRKKSSFGKDKVTEINDDLTVYPEKPESITDEVTDLYRMIDATLPVLKAEYRDVLVLKYIENKSYEEISDILRIPEGTVATRLNRAKQSFKTLAKDSFDHSILNHI